MVVLGSIYIDDIFLVKTGIPFFSCTSSFFFPGIFFCRLRLEKAFSDVVKHMLFENINIQSLNLLNFVYTIVFRFETEPENVKLAILKRLELQIFFAPSQPSGKFSGILHKSLNMVLKLPIANQTHQHEEMTSSLIREVTSSQYFSVQCKIPQWLHDYCQYDQFILNKCSHFYTP